MPPVWGTRDAAHGARLAAQRRDGAARGQVPEQHLPVCCAREEAAPGARVACKAGQPVRVAAQRAQEGLGKRLAQLHGRHGARVLRRALQRVQRRVQVAVHLGQVAHPLARALLVGARDGLDAHATAHCPEARQAASCERRQSHSLRGQTRAAARECTRCRRKARGSTQAAKQGVQPIYCSKSNITLERYGGEAGPGAEELLLH